MSPTMAMGVIGVPLMLSTVHGLRGGGHRVMLHREPVSLRQLHLHRRAALPEGRRSGRASATLACTVVPHCIGTASAVVMTEQPCCCRWTARATLDRCASNFSNHHCGVAQSSFTAHPPTACLPGPNISRPCCRQGQGRSHAPHLRPPLGGSRGRGTSGSRQRTVRPEGQCAPHLGAIKCWYLARSLIPCVHPAGGAEEPAKQGFWRCEFSKSLPFGP